MIFSAGLGSWVTAPSEPKLPSAAIFVAAEMSPPAHFARTVASISSAALGQRAQRDDALPAPKMSRGGETSAPPPKLPRGGGGRLGDGRGGEREVASAPAKSVT